MKTKSIAITPYYLMVYVGLFEYLPCTFDGTYCTTLYTRGDDTLCVNFHVCYRTLYYVQFK